MTPQQRERILRRLSAGPIFLGGLVRRWAESRGLAGDEAIAAGLGVTVRQLDTMRLCRVPVDAEGVVAVAVRTGASTAVIREVCGGG